MLSDVDVETRIWVTGAGLVTPLGGSVAATWGRLVRGERGIGPVELFDATGQRSQIAAQVQGVTLPDSPEGLWSRTSAMALSAAREALTMAKVDARTTRIGVAIGATTGGMFETEALLARLHVDPHSGEVLLGMLTHPLTSTGDRLAETLGPFLHVRTLCSACSSGANALIVGARWLLAGEVDVVLAGGSDGLCRLTFTGFNALNAVDIEPCRPFDRRRRGLTLGEGAGFVVMERGGRAKSRGAKPIAELAGWALGAEAHHITNPEPTGGLVSRLVTRALARAGLEASSLDYVNAHGTGTPLNDPMEAQALARALGKEIERVPVSSSKAQIGHTLGAAGAIEGILSALVIDTQTLIPTAGLDDPDPACRLVHVAHEGRPARVRAALSNSFGFGGMDSVLLFTQPELGPPKGTRVVRVVVTGAATLSPLGIHDARASAEAIAGAPLPANDKPTYDLEAELDAARARRLDRPARLGAVVALRALGEASISDDARADTGLVLGSAFGSVDASAAFMHRVFEKGPRFASPAEFPNLVPSSPVGHASIYLGLGGPVFATADLATSGESAIAQAIQLVAAGEATRIVAGGVEERGNILERVLVTLFARSRADMDAPRAEGAAAVVVESEAEAASRGGKVLARVRLVLEWREDAAALPALEAPLDASRAEIVLPRGNGGIDAILAGTGWARCPRLTCAAKTGEHDGLGAVAVAVAVGRIASGAAREVLVAGLAKGRGYALILTAP